jgi:hypothetical protein
VKCDACYIILPVFGFSSLGSVTRQPAHSSLHHFATMPQQNEPFFFTLTHAARVTMQAYKIEQEHTAEWHS